MVLVKLNENYSNDYLATSLGVIFYRKHNSLGKKENVADIDLNLPEFAVLFKQGLLVAINNEESEKAEKEVNDYISTHSNKTMSTGRDKDLKSNKSKTKNKVEKKEN